MSTPSLKPRTYSFKDQDPMFESFGNGFNKLPNKHVKDLTNKKY